MRKLVGLFGVLVILGSGMLSSTDAAPPGTAAAVQAKEEKAEAKPACPKGHVLRQVPILVGLPNADMIAQMKAGKALLGGCMGVPGSSGKAFVCDQCRQWKTDGMLYWQPLPKDFGTVKE